MTALLIVAVFDATVLLIFYVLSVLNRRQNAKLRQATVRANLVLKAERFHGDRVEASGDEL